MLLLAALSNSTTDVAERDMEKVTGLLRGERIAYIRRFVNGVPVEDILVSKPGRAARGPVANPDIFPPQQYTRLPIQQTTFLSFKAQVETWCSKPPSVLTDKEQSYFSIGILCGPLRTDLIQIPESDIPQALLNILNEVPPP